jgi:hypothetical protein
MNQLRPSPALSIPLLALLPLHLVGCDEFLGSTDDAGDVDDDSTSDAGSNTDSDDNGGDDDGSDDDSGFDDDGGSSNDSGSLIDAGGNDSGDPVLPGSLRDQLQPLLDRYCADAIDCGAFADTDECEDYALSSLYEEIPAGFEPTQSCIDAVINYFDCYIAELECDENAQPPEVYSDASCGSEQTSVGLRCG